jgi:hypothetical protein
VRDSYILWFLKKLNLTYQRLTSFVASFNFIPIVLVPYFPLYHTLIRSLLTFRDQISILIVDCMTTRFASYEHWFGYKTVGNNVYTIKYSKIKLYFKYTNNMYACYKNIGLKEAFYLLY